MTIGVGSMIHPTAEVGTSRIGGNSRIWQNVVVLPGATIGADVNICAFCFVENDVVIGDRVTVKSGVYLWDGLRIGNDVFIGPNATFTNDPFPRSKCHLREVPTTIIESGASIGAGAIILPGITIGASAMVGAGSVVTKSVPANAIVKGNPARITGYVDSSAFGSTAQSVVLDHGGSQASATEIGVSGVTLHQMKRVADIRGNLSVGDFSRDVPFRPERFFFVFDVPSIETRGQHAHRHCHQFLICVKGSCSVVADDGRNRAEVVLATPDLGLYLPPRIWGIQYKYSRDAVLLVFASDPYDPDDYIRSYAEFLEEVVAIPGSNESPG